MDNSMDSMLEAYLFEANELLEHLDEILLNCEKENNFDSDAINEIFRVMHTIKGSSAMMEFDSLATISHKVEDLFFYVRENGLEEQYNEGLVDLVFRASDFLKAEIAKIENGEPLITDIGTFEQEINNFLKKISGQGGAAEAAVQPAPAAAPAVPEKDEKSGGGSVPAQGYPYGVRVFFDEEARMENLRAFMLVNTISETYSDFDYSPKDIQSNPATAEEVAQNGFVIRFRQDKELQGALKIIESFMYTRNYTVLEQAEPDKEDREKKSAKKTSSKKQENAPAAQASHASAKQNLINVNLSKLDSLMDLMGEIVITESMVTSHYTEQQADIDNNFSKSSRQLRKLTDELQEIVMSIRMVPIAGVFQKMNRIVRDMGKKLDKEVDLVLIGEETEVDKTIVDNIGDPLMHLVRNSVDHGIETKEERALTDKPQRGTVTLSAQNTGGEILITVQDDGKGIDREAVLKKAKRQGLLTKAEEEYSDREIYAFLLMPGFSTNEVVTEYSGRGVGMDVVKKNVEKIGGDVTIDSEFGKGTKTVFKIPLTLAIVNGMKVTVGETVFTIPINNIRQSFKISSQDIVYDTNGNEIVMVRGRYYPIIRLHRLYNIPTQVTEVESGIVILVETHETACCLFADALLGEQQVVVKPMPAYLNQFDIKKTGLSGCAILGDGSISLILDIQNLYQSV